MIADLWETIKKSAKKYNENDVYLVYDVLANLVFLNFMNNKDLYEKSDH